MQKREMSTKEQIRETVIKQLVDKKITAKTASKMLKISLRHVKRLKRIFLSEGTEGLIYPNNTGLKLKGLDIGI
ncbi:MAG: helix-turn-helix domain-containing protein, partial [Candidatus Roizmanbacteria bacterium]